MLEIDLDNETDLDRKRRDVYEGERRGIQPTLEGIFRYYNSSDFEFYGSRASRSSIGDSGRFGADRGGSGRGAVEAERGQVSNSVKPVSKAFTDITGQKRLCEEVTKNNGRSLEVLRGDMSGYRDAAKNHYSDNAYVEGKHASNGRAGGLDRGKSPSNGKRGYQKGNRPVSWHFNDDGSEEIIFSDGSKEIRRSRAAIGRSNKYAKEMLTYFKELKQDVEGISKKRHTEKFYNDAVA